MFVVVRHGNTFGADEQPRRIGARTDLPLTERGIEQAYELGRHFAGLNWEFSKALVSPLRRTQQTADAILRMQTRPINAEPAEFLREIDHGPDENKIESAVLDRIGVEGLEAWEEDGCPPPGWVVDHARRLAAWRDLFDSSVDASGPVLLVTSNGAARFALWADPEMRGEASKLPSLKLPTGGYGVITRGHSGGLNIVEWGVRP